MVTLCTPPTIAIIMIIRRRLRTVDNSKVQLSYRLTYSIPDYELNSSNLVHEPWQLNVHHDDGQSVRLLLTDLIQNNYFRRVIFNALK